MWQLIMASTAANLTDNRPVLSKGSSGSAVHLINALTLTVISFRGK